MCLVGLTRYQYVLETNQNFNPKCTDALEFDYSELNLKTSCIFYWGTYLKWEGDLLAASIIEKINSNCKLKN